MGCTGVVLRRALMAASVSCAGLFTGMMAPAQAQNGVVLRPLPQAADNASSAYYTNYRATAENVNGAAKGYPSEGSYPGEGNYPGEGGYPGEADFALEAAPLAPVGPAAAAPAAACGSYASCGSCGACEACVPTTCCQPCFAGPRCQDRWYLSLSGGWQHREDVHEVNDPLVFLEFDDGFAANGALGYRFDLFRVEVEYSFMNNEVERAGSGADLNAIGIGPSNASGNVSVRALMFNIYHDIQLPFTLWTPYVGAGLGTYQSEINSLYPDFFDTAGAPFAGQSVNSTSDFEFAYQFRVGASRPIGERTEFFTGYRYFDGDDLTFSSSPFANFAPTFNPDGAQHHSVEFGLRVRF